MNSIVSLIRDILLDPFLITSAAASIALLLSGAAARVAEFTQDRWMLRAGRGCDRGGGGRPTRTFDIQPLDRSTASTR